MEVEEDATAASTAASEIMDEATWLLSRWCWEESSDGWADEDAEEDEEDEDGWGPGRQTGAYTIETGEGGAGTKSTI